MNRIYYLSSDNANLRRNRPKEGIILEDLGVQIGNPNIIRHN